HALPPAGDVNQGRRLELEVGECPPIALRLRQLDYLDPAAIAGRLGRGRAVGRRRLSGIRLRKGFGTLLVAGDPAGRGIEVPQVAPGASHCARVLAWTVYICRECAYARYSLDLTS